MKVAYYREIFQQLKSTGCFLGKDTELMKLLYSRDKRQNLQREYSLKYSCSLLSITLLAPGSIKKNKLLDYVFQRALDEIGDLLEKQKITIYSRQIHNENTGHFALLAVDSNPSVLKQLMINLEDSSDIARLWDIDVLNKNGEIITRTELGFEQRKCLLCKQNAKICARNRTHEIKDILCRMQKIALDDAFINWITELAAKSLETEASTTPKPGLVDCRNNGAHKDMDLKLFYKSIEAIKPYFGMLVKQGIAIKSENEENTFKQIRSIGIKAEEKMFQATEGINTHKGSIFATGLICTALGYLYRKKKITISNICNFVSALTQSVEQELLTSSNKTTAGINAYKRYKLKGARGEAASGFHTVTSLSLPIFEQYYKLGEDVSLLLTLITLISENQDTNIVNRGGIEALEWIQDYAKNLRNNPKIYHDRKFLIRQLEIFDDECIKRNLSPGGSADLLSLTYLLYHIKISSF